MPNNNKDEEVRKLFKEIVKKVSREHAEKQEKKLNKRGLLALKEMIMSINKYLKHKIILGSIMKVMKRRRIKRQGH